MCRWRLGGLFRIQRRIQCRGPASRFAPAGRACSRVNWRELTEERVMDDGELRGRFQAIESLIGIILPEVTHPDRLRQMHFYAQTAHHKRLEERRPHNAQFHLELAQLRMLSQALGIDPPASPASP